MTNNTPSADRLIIRPKAQALGIAALISIMTVLVAWKFLQNLVPLDEGILLVYPELILKGAIPNLDFCSLYPPGNFWVISLFFKLFGPSIVVERLVGVGYVLAIALALFVMASEFGVVAAVLIAATSGVMLQLFGDALAAYSWFGAMALALWGLALGRRRLALDPESPAARRLLFGCGLLCGLAVVYRHDLAPAILLATIAISGLRVRALLVLGCGLFVGTAPLLVHMAFATVPLFFENLLFDVFRADPGRRLPIPWTSPVFLVVFGSCLIPILLATLHAIFAAWSRSDRFLLAIGLFNLGILPQATSRTDRWHLAYIGFVTIPLAVIAMLHVTIRWMRQAAGQTSLTAQGVNALYWGARAGLLVLAAMIVAFGSAAAGVFVTELQSYRSNGAWACTTCLKNEGRWAPVGRNIEGLQEVVSRLDQISRPGQRLFVAAKDLARTNYSDPYLFHFFPKLIPSQYYIEMAVGVANREGGRTAGDVARADYLLLNETYDQWNEPNASAIRGSEEPNTVVQKTFCLDMKRGPMSLYVRCGTNPVAPR